MRESKHPTTNNKSIFRLFLGSVFCIPTTVFLIPLSVCCRLSVCVCVCARVTEMRKRSRISCLNQNKNRIPYKHTHSLEWWKKSYDWKYGAGVERTNKRTNASLQRVEHVCFSNVADRPGAVRLCSSWFSMCCVRNDLYRQPKVDLLSSHSRCFDSVNEASHEIAASLYVYTYILSEANIYINTHRLET